MYVIHMCLYLSEAKMLATDRVLAWLAGSLDPRQWIYWAVYIIDMCVSVWGQNVAHWQSSCMIRWIIGSSSVDLLGCLHNWHVCVCLRPKCSPLTEFLHDSLEHCSSSVDLLGCLHNWHVCVCLRPKCSPLTEFLHDSLDHWILVGASVGLFPFLVGNLCPK